MYQSRKIAVVDLSLNTHIHSSLFRHFWHNCPSVAPMSQCGCKADGCYCGVYVVWILTLLHSSWFHFFSNNTVLAKQYGDCDSYICVIQWGTTIGQWHLQVLGGTYGFIVWKTEWSLFGLVHHLWYFDQHRQKLGTSTWFLTEHWGCHHSLRKRFTTSKFVLMGD